MVLCMGLNGACARWTDRSQGILDVRAIAIGVDVWTDDESIRALDGSRDSLPDRTPDASPPDVPSDAPDDAGSPDAIADIAPDAAAACDAATCPRVRGLALGDDGFTFAVYADGRVACWGGNGNGQLGMGDTVSVLRPTLNPYLSDVVEMGAGVRHACARVRDGSLYCWGNNDFGQASATAAPNVYSPRRFPGLDGVLQLVVGRGHNCVLQAGGVVRCWGEFSTGDPGSGASPRIPTVVSLSASAIRLSAQGSTTCAELTTGAVACWGRNDSGQLGDGTMSTSTSSRSIVIGLSAPRAFAVGGVHACAIDSTGAVWCWGSNSCAALGNPPGNSLVPRPVAGLVGASLVTLGHVHSCVFRAGAGVECWGSGTTRGFGPSVADWGAAPTLIAGTRSTEIVESGWNHVCAVMNGSRDVACWGTNRVGELGGTLAPGETIVRVALPP